MTVVAKRPVGFGHTLLNAHQCHLLLSHASPKLWTSQGVAGPCEDVPVEPWKARLMSTIDASYRSTLG